MRAVERFCRYAAYDTQSSEVSGTSPSTEKQLVLAKVLCEELTALGAENAHVDEYGYVYGWVPAAPGCEAAPALGLIAHMAVSYTHLPCRPLALRCRIQRPQ